LSHEKRGRVPHSEGQIDSKKKKGWILEKRGREVRRSFSHNKCREEEHSGKPLITPEKGRGKEGRLSESIPEGGGVLKVPCPERKKKKKERVVQGSGKNSGRKRRTPSLRKERGRKAAVHFARKQRYAGKGGNGVVST